MAKIVFVIIDGIGGLPTSVLKNRTALEAAKTPNLDYFAEKGQTGFTKNFKIDNENFLRENGSNFGYISLFGVNPRKTNWKRAPIEAIGIDAEFEEGNLAIRFNFAYVNPKGIVESRRAGRISNEEGKKFTEEIKQKINYSGDYEIKHQLGYRGMIILRSKQELGDDITGSDPLKEGIHPRNVQSLKKTEKNERSANMLRILEQKVNEVLNTTKLNTGRRSRGGYPINRILTRGAGTKLPELPIYDDFAAICTSPVEFGMAKLTKMKILGISKPEEEYKQDIDKTLEVLQQNYEQHDKFLIFIKAPDTFGHDGNSNKKKQSIEYLDKTIFQFLKENINLKEDVLCVTADHATPARLMRHTAEPIPLLISGKIKPDITTKFGERYCKNGDLNEKLGYNIMHLLYKIYRQ